MGTTSTKAVAFDWRGRQLDLESHSYPLISPQEGWFEQDADRLVAAAENALRSLVVRLGTQPAAIGISSAMHGLMLVGSDDQPLTNVIIWADNRSDKEAQALRRSKDALALYQHSGTPIHPMSPLCKLLWLQNNRPDLMEQTPLIVSVKEYLLKRWVGSYVTDQSLASATGLLDNYTGQWGALSLKAARIDISQLPGVVPATTVLPRWRPEVASRLGIDAGVPLVIGGSDGCLANLGSGVLDSSVASLTIGTSSAFRKTVASFVKDEKQRVFNYILAEGLYVVGGPSNNGGVVSQWFEDEFGNGQFDEAGLRSTPAGAGGLLFLPYLMGERAPVWNAEAKGVFFGVQKNHGKNHFYRAVWEGVFRAAAHIAESVEEVSGSVDKVVVSGGFARSRYLIEMLASVLQKPCLLSNTAESSAFGAALLAMHAVGALPALKDAAKLVSYEEEFLPDPALADTFRHQLQKSKRIYEKLKDEFED